MPQGQNISLLATPFLRLLHTLPCGNNPEWDYRCCASESLDTIGCFAEKSGSLKCFISLVLSADDDDDGDAIVHGGLLPLHIPLQGLASCVPLSLSFSAALPGVVGDGGEWETRYAGLPDLKIPRNPAWPNCVCPRLIADLERLQ